jgi:uncharacterized protein YdgA (DUF945 family)
MKISAKLALLAGALIIAYPSAAWVLGRQIEAAADELHAQFEAGPLVKVVERRYQRGIFSSSDTLTLEVFGGEVLGADQNAKSFKVTFKTDFRHGPLVDGLSLGAATSDTELILDADLRKHFAKVVGQQQLFVARTHHRFDGGGTTTLSIPAFAMALPADDGDAPGEFRSDGVSMVLDFEPGLVSYSYRGNAPQLGVKTGEGRHAILDSLTFSGNMKRVFADDTLLYAGTENFSVDQLSFTDSDGADDKVLIKKLVLDADMPLSGEYMDVVGKLGAEVLRVGTQDFGPAHYDFSLRHLHARTVAAVYRAMMDASADQQGAMDAAADPSQLLAPLAAAGQALLKYQPEVHIDRFSFNSTHGEARLAASARLGEVSTEALASPPMLLEKLQADAEIVFPEALIAVLAANAEEAGGANTARDARTEMIEQQLAALTEQGYIARNQGMVSSRVEFKDGALTANGKPVAPMRNH